MQTPTPPAALADWLALDPTARRDQALEGLDPQGEVAQSTLAALARVEAGDALAPLAAGLVARGISPATAVRALAEQLQGARARDIRKWMSAAAAERELLAEAEALLAGDQGLWAEYIVRYLDAPVDGVLAALIRHAGAAAVEPLLALALDEDERDPDSESSGYGPIHAARLLAEVRDERVVAPLLGLLPDLAPEEPMVDAVEAALHAFGDALMAPALAHIEAAEDDEARLAYWMMLARSPIDDDRIRDALVGLLGAFPDDAAYGLSVYGDTAVVPAVLAAFDALSDENPFKVADMAGSLAELGAELSPEQADRVERARAAVAAQLDAASPAGRPGDKPAAAPRRALSPAQKKAAQAKKKVQRQMKKKSRPKKR